MDLLGDDSSSEVDFTINENYARRYENWRRGEELQKLKDKYGNVEDSDDSTSEEDEVGKELTEDVEKQFYKTLSCLKEKNPKIYDQNIRFFETKNGDEKLKHKHNENEKKQPSLSIAGYQRKVLLETGGHFSDNEEEQKGKNHERQPFEMMSSQDQENDIKQSFKDILKDSDNEDEEQWGNLFKKRVKSSQEIKREEEDFRQWLAGEKEKLKDSEVKEELLGLHDYWADPKLDEGEKFLRDYVLNKRYLEHEDEKRIPSYDEIVHDSDSNLSADDVTLNQQEEFEKKYNFRFEEPDCEFIKRYPRTLEQSMRKKNEKRKKQREELKQRKRTERSKKDEELKRLKALKKQEIMDKIKKLQRITGNEDIAFQAQDLEGDFDPKQYDKRMSQIFNDEYYGTGGDDEYPEIPDDEEDLDTENWDDWKGHGEEEEKYELHCEDPGFNMDCDYDPTKKNELQEELIENSRRRKKKKKSKFMESLEREKPIFDPNDKTFEQYVDEYYALDYEDLIGDIPCRFKYRKVVPNDFGLSIDEILNASDQELNRWVSLKKITRRLPEHVELYDVKAYKRKASNFKNKAKCFPSLYGPKADDLDLSCGEISTELKKLERDSVHASKVKPVDAEEGDIDHENKLREKKKEKKTKSVISDKDPCFVSERADKRIRREKAALVAEEKNTTNEKKMRKMNHDEARVSLKGKAGGEVENLIRNCTDNRKKKSKKQKLKNNWIMERVDEDELFSAENIANNDTDIELTKKKKLRMKRKREKFEGPAKESEMLNQKNNCSLQKVKKRKFASAEDKGSPKAFGENVGKIHEKKRKLNSRHNHHNDNELCGLSDERLKSYGLNPKKYRNKLKYKNKNK